MCTLKKNVFRFGVWTGGYSVPVLRRRHVASCYIGIQAWTKYLAENRTHFRFIVNMVLNLLVAQYANNFLD